VINDQVNSDGSFVPPLLESALVGKSTLTLPVVVETAVFSSELILTNWSAAPKSLRFRMVSDSIANPENSAHFQLMVNPGEQRIIPDFVQYLRDQGVSGIGARGGSNYVGALFAAVASGDLSGLSVSARTASPGGGGKFGLFYSALPNGSASTSSLWLYGLQQNSENRANLALVNTGETDNNPIGLQIEIYNGETGLKAGETSIATLKAGGWTQLGAVLTQVAAGVSNGYAKITRTSGNNPFLAYAVINDGGVPNQRTDDGAYIHSAP
jgi:hypothetical protein